MGAQPTFPARKQQQITNENLLCSFLNRFPHLLGAVWPVCSNEERVRRARVCHRLCSNGEWPNVNVPRYLRRVARLWSRNCLDSNKRWQGSNSRATRSPVMTSLGSLCVEPVALMKADVARVRKNIGDKWGCRAGAGLRSRACRRLGPPHCRQRLRALAVVAFPWSASKVLGRGLLRDIVNWLCALDTTTLRRSSSALSCSRSCLASGAIYFPDYVPLLNLVSCRSVIRWGNVRWLLFTNVLTSSPLKRPHFLISATNWNNCASKSE